MVLFPDATSLLYFDIPMFLFIFGVIFIIVRTFVAQAADPVLNTAIAGLAAGAAILIIRSQWKLQQLLWFRPELVWAIVILIFALIVIKWVLHI
ncbi:TPA: hypothetical protein H1012_00090 [archaeon]|nr:hypothetical protein [Candidatus Naiadarchaeales archaeon SRR2090153.bin461]HIK02230.1 hypothetical protein [Candidatus Naiadarchaeales archaeon SRR2090159.bin1288]